MDDAIGDENIWYNNLGIIDKDVAAGDGNGDRLAGQCFEGLTVFELRAVTYRPFHDCSKLSAAAPTTHVCESSP